MRRVVIATELKINTRRTRQGEATAEVLSTTIIYGSQKTFAKDINGMLASDLIMIYLASTSSIKVDTATTLVLRDDEDEDSYYTSTTIVDQIFTRTIEFHM
jgi:hypothetical protein